MVAVELMEPPSPPLPLRSSSLLTLSLGPRSPREEEVRVREEIAKFAVGDKVHKL